VSLTAEPRTSSLEKWSFAVLIIAALALRLAFHTHSLDEWDSVNFALSLIDFNISAKQPHPPGQILYVAIGRLFAGLGANEVERLSLLSALFGTAALAVEFSINRMVFSSRTALVALGLTSVSYGVLLNDLRPISDSVAACFVYLTLLALLKAERQPRWLPAAAVAFGVTLGVKQLALFFLVPVFVLALVDCFRAGRRSVAMLATALLAAVVALWLIPSAQNAGGFRALFHASREQQRFTWTAEATLTHLTRERVARQLRALLVDWPGGAVLAAAVFALALAGCAAAVTRRRLKVLVYLATVLTYCLLFMYPYAKYAVYYLPAIIAFAAEGCSRIFRPPSSLFTAASVLAVSALVVVIPAAREAAAFRAGPDAALPQVTQEAGGTRIVASDNPVVLHHLEYLKAKHPELRIDDLEGMLDSFGAAQLHYVMLGIDYAADAKPLGHWRWSGRFFEFAGRSELRDVWLYQVVDDPPARLTFDAVRRFTPLAPAVSSDHWVGTSARCLLGVPTAAMHLEIAGAAPRLRGRKPRYHVAVRVGGVETTGFEVSEPGAFAASLPLPVSVRGAPTAIIEIIPGETWVPAELDPRNGDRRRLAFQLNRIEIF
jgi:hypothetical protein